MHDDFSALLELGKHPRPTAGMGVMWSELDSAMVAAAAVPSRQVLESGVEQELEWAPASVSGLESAGRAAGAEHPGVRFSWPASRL